MTTPQGVNITGAIEVRDVITVDGERIVAFRLLMVDLDKAGLRTGWRLQFIEVDDFRRTYVPLTENGSSILVSNSNHDQDGWITIPESIATGR